MPEPGILSHFYSDRHLVFSLLLTQKIPRWNFLHPLFDICGSVFSEWTSTEIALLPKMFHFMSVNNCNLLVSASVILLA